ncbi:hypothetical protein LXL04_021975 [Taraxacum kok-saghyz]
MVWHLPLPLPLIYNTNQVLLKSENTYRTADRFPSTLIKLLQTPSMASGSMTLRLLVDKPTRKVLYAETTKEFVDFLLHIFSLPLGTVIQLLGSKQMVGCLGKLKESVENFNQLYFQPGIDKDTIFNPKTPVNSNLFLLSNFASDNVKPATSTTIYSCSSIGKYTGFGGISCRNVTGDPATSCPNCRNSMNVPLNFVGPPARKEAEMKLSGGFVKEVVTYMVMDDLAVKPMSTISSITLINSFGVKDLNQLEEKTLRIGEDEVALKLLKASLSTNERYANPCFSDLKLGGKTELKDKYVTIKDNKNIQVNKQPSGPLTIGDMIYLDNSKKLLLLLIKTPYKPSFPASARPPIKSYIKIQYQYTPSMASSTMTLKLLVDKKAQKVLFAEATKEFVDFLFHIFSLPLGTLVQLIGSTEMVGCLGKLKESMENFNQAYLQTGIDKDVIFNPKMGFNGNMFLLLDDAFADDDPVTAKTLYRCSYSPNQNYYGGTTCTYKHVTENQNFQCPSCQRPMNVVLTSVGLTNKAEVEKAVGKRKKLTGGYVKDVVTYMVMDNLVVKPMSTISSITLINSFDVKDLSQLEEKTFHFGKDEAMKLLKTSLMTDQVLTTLYRPYA